LGILEVRPALFYHTRLKIVSSDEHSSLFRTEVSDEEYNVL